MSKFTASNGAISIREMIDRLKNIYLHTSAAVLIQSGPGQGKTASLVDLIQELQNQDKDFGGAFFNCANAESIDMRGLPKATLTDKNGQLTASQYGAPQWTLPVPELGLKGVWKDMEKGIMYPRGVCVFDEVLQVADESVLLPLAQHMDEGRIGGWALPREGWLRVYLTNRAEDRAGVQRLHMHTRNRFAAYEVFLDYDTVAPIWETKYGMRDEFIGFAGAEPQTVFTTSVPSEERQYCTPRSFTRAWEDCRRYLTWKGLTEEDALPVADPVFAQLIAARIGEAACLKFLDYVEKIEERPDFQEILDDPKEAQIPTHSGVHMAVVEMLIRLAKKEHFAKVFQYMRRMPKHACGIFCARMLHKHGSGLMRDQGFTALIQHAGANARIQAYLG